jgi:thiamine-phosphate diphosphorylase
MVEAENRVPSLFWISPGEGLSEELFQALAACVREGLDGFQLRERHSFPRDLLSAVARFREVLPADKGWLIVNDRLDLALASAADGVHLRRTSLPPAVARKTVGRRLRIGASIHDEEELLEALAGEVDYVFASPVFPVRKSAGPPRPPLGLMGLKELAAKSTVPVIALGGILPANAAEVLATGVHGLAFMRGPLASGDPAGFVRSLRELLG